jgi:hypothetical protein
VTASSLAASKNSLQVLGVLEPVEQDCRRSRSHCTYAQLTEFTGARSRAVRGGQWSQIPVASPVLYACARVRVGHLRATAARWIWRHPGEPMASGRPLISSPAGPLPSPHRGQPISAPTPRRPIYLQQHHESTRAISPSRPPVSDRASPDRWGASWSLVTGAGRGCFNDAVDRAGGAWLICFGTHCVPGKRGTVRAWSFLVLRPPWEVAGRSAVLPREVFQSNLAKP